MQTTSTQRVLITGAAGALGSALIEKFALSYFSIVAVDVREGIQNPNTVWHLEDIRRIDWKHLLQKCDFVIHAAAYVHRSTMSNESISECNSINTTATIQLASACAEANIPFVFISSIAVYGNFPTGYPVSEAYPIEPVSPYGISKASAEKSLVALSSRGLPVVILRFPLLYGPGGRGNMERLLRAIRNHRYWPINSNALKSLVYIPDAANSVLRVVTRNIWDGGIYNVAPQSPSTLNEIQNFAYEASGYKKPLSLPPLIPKVAARCFDWAAHRIDRHLALGETIESLLKPTWSDGKKYFETFGFCPQTPISTGLLATMKFIDKYPNAN
jgi:UDP-glucose 4-epimerase